MTWKAFAQVPKATRFIFVLLGPMDAGLDYHQVGRSMSTCLANEVYLVKVRANTRTQVFRASAYTITDRQYLISAVNEFFDASTVVPPGDIENANLVDFRNLRQSNNINAR